MTTTFRVDDMTCGHCVATITKAVQAADAGAAVTVDLARHLVSVESAGDAGRIAAAISEAGYTPVPVAVPAETPAAATSRGCGGGCGCR